MSTKQLNKPVGNQIFNLEILANIFSLFQCTDSNCSERAILYKHILNDGLQRFYVLKCIRCHLRIAEFPATLPIGITPKEVHNSERLLKRGQSQINTRSMVAVHFTSLSWADFRLLCSIMVPPVPAKTMPTNTLNRVAECSKRTALNSMKQAAIDVHSSEGAIESTITGVINCTVSFDSSWHRRGHYSNQGLAGVIEAYNGKVLDYVLYDRVCYQCSKWNQERKENEPDEYTSFWNTHKDFCTSNFSGSSQAMEGSAAADIWARSVQLHQLHYSTYIGDGDSSSFKNQVNSNPYKGAIEIRKEECLVHLQKRLKSRLKKKTSGSKGLFEPKADRIAHLYALVVHCLAISICTDPNFDSYFFAFICLL